MSIKKTIEEKTDKHLIPKAIPWWKWLIIILLVGFIGIGVYYTYQGFFIEVLSVLSAIFFSIGLILVFAYVASKELFLFLIGKRSEYNKVLNASQKVSIGLTRFAINAIPMGLDKEEKARLKEDVPVFIQMRFMATINDFITRVFIGAFAAAFGLLGTIVLMKQNQKIDFQNEKIDIQNEKVNIQNNLIEAERRSSLIFLMSNILDKVDEEIREQKLDLKKDKKAVTDNTKFFLSKPLVSRIIALSRAFRPYKLLDNDTLSTDFVSPERGQLFIALMGNNLDSITQNTIVAKGDFSNAIIGEIDLSGAKLRRAKLRGADLRGVGLEGADLREAKLEGADLRGAKLEGADLRWADLRWLDLEGADLEGADLEGADLARADLTKADLTRAVLRGAYLWGADLARAFLEGVVLEDAILRGADLSWADLRRADLRGAKLKGVNLNKAKGLKIEQLLKVESFYLSKNLDSILKSKIEKEKPCLFTKNGCS